MAICSLNPPGNLAIVSKNGGFLAPGTCLRRQMPGGRLKLLSAAISNHYGLESTRVIRCRFIFSRVIRCRFIFSGKNDELTPDFFGQE